jgi:plasmid stability protein
LLVRNLDRKIVQALKLRAARLGRSAEAEHRAILEAALGGVRADLDFKGFLLAMPDPGQLRIRRSKDRGRTVRL